jgi:uncharacterized protein (UPF0210 family)
MECGIMLQELGIGPGGHGAPLFRPVPGAKPGAIIHFGGLLGSAPVMKVADSSSARFIERRGRVPSPILALRN